jgi:excisionase family DNA binding protein
MGQTAETERPAGEQLWRVEQVAERLAISRSGTYKLIAEGRLRSVQIGAARRVSETAVRDFIASLS